MAQRGEQMQMQVEFGDILEANLEMLRTLNVRTFPVRYNSKFYQGILETPPEFSQYAYVNGFVVGAVCSRVEVQPSGKKRLYIMTLGVLTAYRGRGIGSKLLEYVISNAEKAEDITEIYLHVQTSNQEAITFYERFGFRTTDCIKNYYKRIEPPDCFVVTKVLREA